MLLRTILLFLCVSSCLCATLSLFLMREEEKLAQDPTPVLDNVVEALDGNIQETEATAHEKTIGTSPPEEEKIMGNEPEEPEVGHGVQEVQEVEEQDVQEVQDVQDGGLLEAEAASEDVAAAEEVVTQSDNTVEAEVIQEHQPPQQEEDNQIKPVQIQKPEEQNSRWGFNSIRSGFQNMNGYFESLVELVGGRNGVCQYRCRYGKLPDPRPGYQLPEPNGCSSSLVGFQLDLGIPTMTQCCDQLDICYDTCGTNKYDCDTGFRSCLHGICSDLKKSLGLGTQYQTCESAADGLFNTVWTLGCRPYMNSQRAACVCDEEEKDEL
ncbi:group XIIB secretory phospholipase A2-like protein [Eucyclogobius newberryi]|uniref:group XIIB secretory phospholipase A2-like protein n=1 Tax=Eucyclogobius newberryi TaxID=166745 RepID=UPI003B5C114A